MPSMSFLVHPASSSARLNDCASSIVEFRSGVTGPSPSPTPTTHTFRCMAAEPSNFEAQPIWLRQTDAVPAFVPAIELNRGFYDDVVGPLLTPFPHSAALIGWGSQVLGYDSERSTDHGWGPRIKVFTDRSDVEPAQAVI